MPGQDSEIGPLKTEATKQAIVGSEPAKTSTPNLAGIRETPPTPSQPQAQSEASPPSASQPEVIPNLHDQIRPVSQPSVEPPPLISRMPLMDPQPVIYPPKENNIPVVEPNPGYKPETGSITFEKSEETAKGFIEDIRKERAKKTASETRDREAERLSVLKSFYRRFGPYIAGGALIVAAIANKELNSEETQNSAGQSPQIGPFPEEQAPVQPPTEIGEPWYVTPIPEAQSPELHKYTVKEGDSLSSIITREGKNRNYISADGKLMVDSESQKALHEDIWKVIAANDKILERNPQLGERFRVERASSGKEPDGSALRTIFIELYGPYENIPVFPGEELVIPASIAEKPLPAPSAQTLVA